MLSIGLFPNLLVYTSSLAAYTHFLRFGNLYRGEFEVFIALLTDTLATHSTVVLSSNQIKLPLAEYAVVSILPSCHGLYFDLILNLRVLSMIVKSHQEVFVFLIVNHHLKIVSVFIED